METVDGGCIITDAISVYTQEESEKEAFGKSPVGTLFTKSVCGDPRHSAAITGGTGVFQCAEGTVQAFLMADLVANAAVSKQPQPNKESFVDLQLCNVDQLCYLDPVTKLILVSVLGGSIGAGSAGVVIGALVTGGFGIGPDNCQDNAFSLPSRVTFCEGNGGTQTEVCNIDAREEKAFRSGQFGCDNDEARSMWITGPVPKGTEITVYDARNNNFYDDDYATVEITRDIPQGTTVLVPTFEFSGATVAFTGGPGNLNTLTDSFATIRYTRKNGLDGKVSRFFVNTP